MSKKDYLLLARLLRKQRLRILMNPHSPGEYERFVDLVSDMTYALKLDNSRFSKDKFANFVFEDEVHAAEFVK